MYFNTDVILNIVHWNNTKVKFCLVQKVVTEFNTLVNAGLIYTPSFSWIIGLI